MTDHPGNNGNSDLAPDVQAIVQGDSQLGAITDGGSVTDALQSHVNDLRQGPQATRVSSGDVSSLPDVNITNPRAYTNYPQFMAALSQVPTTDQVLAQLQQQGVQGATTDFDLNNQLAAEGVSPNGRMSLQQLQNLYASSIGQNGVFDPAASTSTQSDQSSQSGVERTAYQPSDKGNSQSGAVLDQPSKQEAVSAFFYLLNLFSNSQGGEGVASIEGLTPGWLAQYMKDPAKRAELAKKYPELVAKFSDHQALTVNDVASLAPEDRAAIKNSLAQTVVSQTGTDYGTMAVAVVNEKLPNQLTKSELSNPDNVSLQKNINDSVHEARSKNGSGQGNLDMVRIGFEKPVGKGDGTCLAKVAQTLDEYWQKHRLGNRAPIEGMDSTQAVASLEKQPKHFKEIAIGDIQPGDLVFYGPSSGHPYGHSSVDLGYDSSGHHLQSSDHVHDVVDPKNYSWQRAFRIIDNGVA